MKRLLVSALLLAAAPAFAGEGNAGLLERWYAALGAAAGVVDAPAVAELLAADASMELRDLGVTQTRDEFVAGLDEWADAIAGGTIRHRIVSDTPAETRATVCYAFAGSEMLTDERYTIAGGRITASVQTGLGDDCAGF